MDKVSARQHRFTLLLSIGFAILGILGVMVLPVTLLNPPEEHYLAESSGGSMIVGVLLLVVTIGIIMSYVRAPADKRGYIIGGIFVLWAGTVDRLLPGMVDIQEHVLRMIVLPVFGVGMLLTAYALWQDYRAPAQSQ